MTLRLDHLVILVHDLAQTIADYTALGFNVQRGGTHADGATHNALVGFADGSYLELISFLKPAPTHRWSTAHATGREGLIDFALLPSSVGAVVDAARSRGLSYTGPLDGGRVRPDGERLAWQIGTPPSSDLPFLCGDLTPRALRVPEGSVRVHPNGVQGVASVTLGVADLEASLARYRALLGPQAPREVVPLSLPGLNLRIVVLTLGATSLVLAARTTQGTDVSDGLLGIALGSTNARSVRTLSLPSTHGAPIELVPA